MRSKAERVFLSLILLSVILFTSCQSEKKLSFSEQLQAALDDGVKTSGVKGATATVLDPVNGNWTGASGMSDSANNVAMTSGMVFGLGNITETYIAACILQLSEEGLLGLDDPIGNYLPSFDYISGSATIRQLLNHTSGVFNFLNHANCWTSIAADKSRLWKPEEVLKSFLMSTIYEPGGGFLFSNSNYLLLGMVVNKVTGNSLSAELRKRFLVPLNLENTYFEVEELPRGTMAHGWMDSNWDDVLEDTSSWPRTAMYSTLWASGAMFGDVLDTANWLKALVEGRVLKAGSLDQMLKASSYQEFGLGIFQTTFRNRFLWGQNGGTFDYNSVALYAPQSKVTIALLVNQGYQFDPYAQDTIIQKILNVLFPSS